MNILTGLPIGIKIVGGIVTAATAVAVPTVIIINNSNANKPPETPQAHMVQQVKPEEPKEIAVAEEAPKSTTEPVKVEPVAPVKTEQPAPHPTPAPVLTKEELFAQAVTEFKATVVISGNKEVTGKDFLDRMKDSYINLKNNFPDDHDKKLRVRLEHFYPISDWSMTMPVSFRFAKILQNYGLIDANLSEEKFAIQARNVAYPYLIDLAISGNY